MSVKVDQIIRSERKSLEIQISVEGHIIVRAPMNESMESIERYIEEKKFYLLRTQQITKAKYLNDLHKRYEEGETFLYLGKERPLKIVDNKSIPLKYENGTFYLSSAFIKLANKVFIDWYKDSAREYISNLTNRFSKLYDINFNKIIITNAYSQWGSCSGNGNLNFSWRAILIPHEVISYLVVHELAHIVHHNHSDDYWVQVERMMPDYIKYENWLKKNDHICSMFKNEMGTLFNKNQEENIEDKNPNDQLEFKL
tara:strand:+ start:3619 stop:4383 length:765 start_codon:yes stop_codon:yes gene_type:complete